MTAATVNGEIVTFSKCAWLARQGNKEAQQILAECLALEAEERAFWAYKVSGGDAFSVEAWKLEQVQQVIEVYPMNGDVMAEGREDATSYDLMVKTINEDGSHDIHRELENLSLEEASAAATQAEADFPDFDLDWIYS